VIASEDKVGGHPGHERHRNCVVQEPPGEMPADSIENRQACSTAPGHDRITARRPARRSSRASEPRPFFLGRCVESGEGMAIPLQGDGERPISGRMPLPALSRQQPRMPDRSRSSPRAMHPGDIGRFDRAPRARPSRTLPAMSVECFLGNGPNKVSERKFIADAATRWISQARHRTQGRASLRPSHMS